MSSANSLIGSTTDDDVGISGVVALSNGNYVVSSGIWNLDGSHTKVGAVTFGNGTVGVHGVVSSANSLIGSTSGDTVGISGATALSNGNYVVGSASWSLDDSHVGVGAVTWGSGTSGVQGAVSSANSLVGSTSGDYVGGNGVWPLSNGNYVVNSPDWSADDNHPAVGAVTWGSGTSGVQGAVSSTNSLVGSTSSDQVGDYGVTALSNGNYVVSSGDWSLNGTHTQVGAVTFGSGTAGVHGAVSIANSLIGSSSGDNLGVSGVAALSNGSYVVSSPAWSLDASHPGVGAVTCGSGTTGVTGAVSIANSLIGSTSNDEVGLNGVTALRNGNYVVGSQNWSADAGHTKVGAVTFGDGTTGVTGAVSSANSLIGSTSNDQVGSYGSKPLSNGNYVVSSEHWTLDGSHTSVGAVTFGDGTAGVHGVVSSANSLIGSTSNDRIGDGGVKALGDGNYVVDSTTWDDGALSDAGAATWASGSTGLSGPITSANSALGPVVSASLQQIVADDGAASFIVSFAGPGTVGFAPQSTGFGPAAGPSVSSIVRAGGAVAETAAGSVDFTVTFSEAVSGVNAADFLVHTEGNAHANGTVTVKPVSYTQYTVTVSGLHGQGDVRLDLVDNDSIVGTAGGGPLGGSGVNNGSFTGAAYHLLQTFPKLDSIIASGTTTSASSVSWTVTLSAPVTGVDATDFTLVNAGVSEDAAVLVTPLSASVYRVTATGVSGVGSLVLHLVDDGTIQDAQGNPLQGTTPPAFTAQPSPAAGSLPLSVAVADVNGDGWPDLVTANSGSDTVSVLLGDGRGGFAAKTDFATGSNPQFVAVADVNGDGQLDLVVANYWSDTVSVLLGNGSGGFAAKTDFATGNLPVSVAVADVNGDGRPDLVTANSLSNTVSVLLGNGSGGFAAKMDLPAGDIPYSVAVADVNGDGQPDLVVANYGSDNVSVLRGNGSGGFAAKTDFPTGRGPRSVAVADVNGDGQPDLVIANAANGANQVSVLLGDGSGGFAPKTDFDTGAGPYSVAVADVNGDGQPDLVTANFYPHTVSVLLGNGSGGFAAKTDFAAGTGLHFVTVADVNRDGQPDLVTASYADENNVSVLLGAGAGTFTGGNVAIQPPTISIADTSVLEGNAGAPHATFTVSLSHAGLVPITVEYATVDGTAVAPGDYLPLAHRTLTFMPGETTKTIDVAIRPDTLFESGADETFLVKLSHPANATFSNSVAVGTILSDDAAPAHAIALDATHPFTFFDRNHDKVTVKLTGAGTGTLILDGGVLDGAISRKSTSLATPQRARSPLRWRRTG